ncbi:HDOD domain-containing protein [Desulfosarcina sp.]|uniref:HDOD domain-containing protein n=1 Tax=Desulfosarcina sp. TaxID=2027861 RepID=UPI003970559A
MGISKNYHVASGSFEVGNTQPRRLQAFLGTCVGVAVFDDTAGVGGLIHLLLPEPVSIQSMDQPEKFATTGMPLFLNKLLELGATRKKMQAVIAGGALVGPLTPQDIHLDIGGRTAEKVIATLNAEGIQMVRSETGGFFTCCIELDMQNWQYAIQPVGFDAVGMTSDEASPQAADVQQTIESIQPIPQVALKVLRIIEEGAYEIDKVAEEVKKDQVISARTIQLCNSAMFTKHHDVASLDHALVFLGQELFIRLVISAAVQSYFSQSGNGYSLCKGGLYHHAIGTARLAEKIAGLTATALPGIAYTAGLLHDIGKVVLDQYITGAYPMLYREFQNRQSEIIDVETRILGMDHTRVGALLARRWSLPDCLANAIRFHHRPEENQGSDALTTIVYLADLLMSRFHSGLELERMGTENLTDHLSRLGLSSGQFNELVDLIPSKILESTMQPNENGS